MALQNELTKVNNEQTVLSQLLEIAEFFRNPQNRTETIDGFWSFEKINSLLRSWAIPLNTDLKQASFEEVLDFLKGLLPKELLQTTVPNSEVLKELIENSELASAKSDEVRQNAILKAGEEISDLYRKNLEKKLVERLTQSPIPPEKRTEIANELSNNLQREITYSSLPLTFQKLNSAPPETSEHRQLTKEVNFRFSGIWQTAVNKTAESHNLTAEQTEYLQTLSSTANELIQPLQTWATVDNLKAQIAQRIPEGTAEEITETLVLNRVFHKPAITEKPILLTPEKRSQETVAELKQATTLALNLSEKQLTEISHILDEIQGTIAEQTEKISRVLSPALTPEKASLIAVELGKYLPDNLAEFTSLIPSAQEIENAVIASIWQMVGSEIPLKPAEAVGIANALTNNPQILIPLRQFSHPISLAQKQTPLQIIDNGKTIIQQVKEIIFKNGINLKPESDKKLISLRENIQAVVLIQAGMTPQDLEAHTQTLIKAGLSENSPQVREIRVMQKLLPEIIQKAQTTGFPQKTIQNWQKQPYPLVRIFLSRFNTVLKKIGLAEKIKLPIKFALERSTQSSMQKLYSLVFIPWQIKELTAIKLPSFFSKIGRQSLSFIGEKILPPRLVRNFGEGIASVFTGQNRTVNSVISASQRLLSSLTSVTSMATNVSGFLIAGLVAVVILIFVVLFSAGGAMYLPSATTTMEGETPAGGCFTFAGEWSSSDKELINKSVATLLNYPAFINSVCSRGAINLVRKNEDDYCFVNLNLDIDIANKCLGNLENTLYSLSHELGHVLAVNSNLYFQFLDQVGNSESFLCSYPLTKTFPEDFPETVAVYIMNRIYPNHSYGACGGPINMTNRYPVHYNFINGKL